MFGWQALSAQPDNNPIVYALPRTVIKVAVTTEKESIRTGPYARFAQRYLGVVAPLADKDMYSIKSVQLGYGEEPDPSLYLVNQLSKNLQGSHYTASEVSTPLSGYNGEGFVAVSHLVSDTSFVKVPVDKQAITDGSAENMAQAAANTIYMLRKRRIELITGEQGENVFGGGLKAALDEIDRLEQEYMSLFLGKHYRQTEVRVFSVVPAKDEKNSVAFRFNENAGVLAASDLTGRPITLEFTPEIVTSAVPATKLSGASKDVIYYRPAVMAECKVTDGRTELAQERIPVYQFGDLVPVAIK